MKLTKLKLVTIITEAVLEPQLIQSIKKLGAKGHTAINSHGEGTSGIRSGEIPGENVRIETLVSDQVAEKIMEHLSTEYFKDYALICYVTEAEVLRSEKYL